MSKSGTKPFSYLNAINVADTIMAKMIAGVKIIDADTDTRTP
jgi:hypothetical protein